VRTRTVLSTLFVAFQALDNPQMRISTSLLLAAARDLRALIESDAEEE
jgi:hypothetical protein